MTLIKIKPDATVKIFGQTVFSTLSNEMGEGGSEFVSPFATTIYDISGTIVDTVTGDVPDSWKSWNLLTGYVRIGTSATKIGNTAFNGNYFRSVTIPDSVTTIGNFAFATNPLSAITMGNSVTSIGDFAFTSHRLSSLTIPDSVITVGNGSFRISETLTFVTIPSSVIKIANAFDYCYNLSTVNCYTTRTAFISGKAFEGVNVPLTIHARSTDSTWTAGSGLTFQGKTNVTIIKDL